jgi:iron complex outermembrane receptor protein
MALIPIAAAAQDEAEAPEEQASDEIVVTGTLLRNAPPVGQAVNSLGEEKIAETGATTSNELLATVPQVSNLFNNVPTARLGVASNQIQVVRPNLRNLAGETSSSASTLVLFDGHRVAPVGVTQNAVDPDLIPPIAIERVEVVTDGGSATYGSDAVGGVINFITRKRFDGVKVTARYGFADDYKQYDAGAIVGRDWGSGSVFVAYNYQHNDALFGRDRDFIREVDWLSPNLTPRGRSCSPGNVLIGANMFALPALTSTVPNVCDPSDDSTVVPRSTRHGAIAGLHQELASWLTADVRAFYGERRSTGFSPHRGSVGLSGASSPGFPPFLPPSFRNFYYTPVPGQNPTASQTVFYTLAPLLGQNSARSTTEFQEWGANAELRFNLDDNWQLRTLFNYSRSNSEFHIEEINSALQNTFANGTTAETTINFYNPGAGSGDRANIARLVDSELAGQGKQSLLNARAILDGTLFTLPGGEVKVAVGAEYMRDAFRQRTSDDAPIGTLRKVAFSPYRRTIKSAFGEVQIPIIGPDMELGFIHSLTLAGSVRYDDYSDVGDTTNPKIGVTLKPIEWLGLRGNWSTSFNAPSPNDQLGALRNTANFFPLNAFINPSHTGPLTPTVTGTVAVQGSNPGLVPQEAEIWSVGFDINPPFLEGFNASATYYNVKFENLISIPTPNSGIFANFPNNVIANPTGITLTQLTNFLNSSGAPNAATALATAAARCNPTTGVCNIYELVDFRQGNYGTVKVQGIDFSVFYRMTTGFGGIDAGVSGNYQLKRKTQTGVGAPVIDQLRKTNLLLPNGTRLVNNANGRLQLQATLGADIGSFRAQATLNHSSGYGVVRCDATTTPVCIASATGVPTASALPQDRVGDFNTVNLFFKYEVPGDSVLLRDLEFTVNVNNVFNQDPPLFRNVASNSASGYANGFTLGRLVQFGVSKKF